MTRWDARFDATAYLRSITPALIDGMDAGMAEVLTTAKQDLESESHMASGTLAASVKVRVATLTGSTLTGTVAVEADYAEDFEYGSPPKLVPYERMLEWARDKAARGQLDRSPEEVASYAQRAVRIRGTRPTRLFEGALLGTDDRIVERIGAAIDYRRF